MQQPRFELPGFVGRLPVARRLWPMLALAVSGLALGQTPGAAPAVSAAMSAAAAPAAGVYVAPMQVDMTDLLAPPPADGSEAARRDLSAVLEAQRTARAQHLREHAIADASTTCGRFDDELGAELTSARMAPVLAFLNHAAREGSALSAAPKKYWQRRRPFVVDPQVERLADVAPNEPAGAGMRAAQALARTSYPSGHATFGTVCAILLADMVPEKRRELFARGQDYAHSRLVVGAHFPSDIEAGRIVGTVAVALMRESAQFQHDFAAARAQLRAALGLSATPQTESDTTVH
jgi:acid phosphatase (class A)